MEILFSFLFRIAVFVFVLSSVGLIVFMAIFLKRRKSSDKAASIATARRVAERVSLLSYVDEPENPPAQEKGLLPNGYSRRDYHDFGITDQDIEEWGLDQPGAPEPYSAGLMIADTVTEGDLDNRFEWSQY